MVSAAKSSPGAPSSALEIAPAPGGSPETTPWTRFAGLFVMNVSVALALLLLLKIGLVGNNVVGTEAYGPGLKLGLKALLFLGKDVLGAVVFALLVSGLAMPFAGRGLGPALGARIVSALLQAAHGCFAAVSFFTTIFVGAPLDKAALDLAFLDQPGVVEGGGALSSSIGAYLNPWTITALILSALVPAMLLLRRRAWPDAGLSARPWLRRLVLAAAGLLFVLTVGVLPFLINGELMGIRVHTFGLERSAGVELVGSYLKPVLRPIFRDARPIADPFRFDTETGNTELTAPGQPAPLAAATPKRTNVIVISLESVGQVYLPDDKPPMPFLQTIGHRRGGLRFTRHYSTWPQTMKAFFSIFCSEHPYPFYQSISAVNPTIPCKSVSEAVHDAGYFTALLTSADLAYDRKMRFFKHRAFDLFWDMRNMPGREGVWGDSWGHDERHTVKKLLELASEERDQPFFFFYEMATAHHPYISCAEHAANPLPDERASYRRALGFIDERIREIVAGLEVAGLLDDTLIVIYSDHAEGFGQHQGSRSHGPKVYEENVLVPFAVLGPQLKEVSGVSGLTTSHLDIAPTLLGLLGIDVPCTMKGRDLRVDGTPRYAMLGGRPPGDQKGLVDGHWKYIIEESRFEMLFDLTQDPGEQRNLISEQGERAARYREIVLDWEAYGENLIERYAEILGDSACTATTGPAGGAP